MITKKSLIDAWISVWEEGLTELEVQKRYFDKLGKKLNGEDRLYLKAIKTKIDELEKGLQNFRTNGDGTEWLIEKDKTGKVYKRAIGSDKRIYINSNRND
tara:strand:+ start:778 stop:1077 length:300 start_codon:yes stop_codon:yes gene_type:complete